MLSAVGMAQTTGSVHFDASKKHQKITGFGAFVCSPQFQYNHMSTADINEVWGTFSPLSSFTATTATYTCNVNGQHIVQLPFTAVVPGGVNVYTLTADLKPEAISGTLPAGQPLLVEAKGEVTFEGSGTVTYAPSKLTDAVLPIVTTAINTPLAPTDAAPRHSLMGTRVNADYQGIVIINGHKYLNK